MPSIEETLIEQIESEAEIQQIVELLVFTMMRTQHTPIVVR